MTRTASGPILWYMKACGFAGWALNVTTDTTAQVAAVLGTLIADLQANGVLQ